MSCNHLHQVMRLSHFPSWKPTIPGHYFCSIYLLVESFPIIPFLRIEWLPFYPFLSLTPSVPHLLLEKRETKSLSYLPFSREDACKQPSSVSGIPLSKRGTKGNFVSNSSISP